MSDLVKELREEADIVQAECYSWLNPLLVEAADRIERLEAALTVIAECENPESNHTSSARADELARVYFESVRAIARSALEQNAQEIK